MRTSWYTRNLLKAEGRFPVSRVPCPGHHSRFLYKMKTPVSFTSEGAWRIATLSGVILFESQRGIFPSKAATLSSFFPSDSRTAEEHPPSVRQEKT